MLSQTLLKSKDNKKTDDVRLLENEQRNNLDHDHLNLLKAENIWMYKLNYI